MRIKGSYGHTRYGNYGHGKESPDYKTTMQRIQNLPLREQVEITFNRLCTIEMYALIRNCMFEIGEIVHTAKRLISGSKTWTKPPSRPKRGKMREYLIQISTTHPDACIRCLIEINDIISGYQKQCYRKGDR
jgi:hypothetical protein